MRELCRYVLQYRYLKLFVPLELWSLRYTAASSILSGIFQEVAYGVRKFRYLWNQEML